MAAIPILTSYLLVHLSVGDVSLYIKPTCAGT